MASEHIINILPDEAAWKQAAKQWHRELLKLPVLSMGDSTKYMTGLPGCTTNQYLGTVQASAQFYPYAADKRGSSETNIEFRELPITFGAMNYDFVPNDYVQTLLGKGAAVLGEGQAKSQMAKLILAEILRSAGENLALALADAKYAANGNTSNDLFDGFVTIIKAEAAANKLSTALKNYEELTTPIDDTNCCEAMKSILFGLDRRLRRQDLFVYCDPALVDYYNESYQLTHTALVYNKQYNQPYVEGSNGKMTFAPLDALAGSDYMWVAPKMNVVYGHDGMSRLEKLEVIRHDVDTFTAAAKIFFGVNFRTLDYRFLKVFKLATN